MLTINSRIGRLLALIAVLVLVGFDTASAQDSERKSLRYLALLSEAIPVQTGEPHNEFQELPGMTTSIEVQRDACVTATLTAQVQSGTAVIFRMLLQAVPMEPNEFVVALPVSGTTGSYGFSLCGVAPGTYIVQVQWKSTDQEQAQLSSAYRSLVVLGD